MQDKREVIYSVDRFIPANEHSEKYIKKKFNNGDRLLLPKIKPIRSPKFHKKFFVMIREAYKHYQGKDCVKTFRNNLVFEAGFYTTKISFSGEVFAIPQTLEYGDLDNDEFADVYSKVLDEILKHVVVDNDAQLDFIRQFS